MKTYDLSLFSDHQQFYLQDEAVEGDLGDAWTVEAASRLLAVTPGVVGVGTVYSRFVPVRIDI